LRERGSKCWHPASFRTALAALQLVPVGHDPLIAVVPWHVAALASGQGMRVLYFSLH